MNMITTINSSTSSSTMSSLEIAELTGKEHRNVMRDIRNMLNELGLLSFELSSYTNAQNKEQPMYELDKELTMTLVTGYSVKLRNAVIKRWEELEAKVATFTLPDFTNPVEAAQAWIVEYEAKLVAEEQLRIAAPKVEFVQRYVETDGLQGFRQVAKLLEIKEKDFRSFLQDNKIMYHTGRCWMAYQPHINAGRLVTKTGMRDGKAYSTPYFTSKGVQWVSDMIKKK